MRTIPELEEGTHRAKASGTLPSGQPVIVNADGTVSVAGLATLTQGVGSAVVFKAATSLYNLAVYDPGNDKVIVGYFDYSSSSGRGTAVVGTVSGQSISFGSPTVFTGNSPGALSAAFDVNAGSVIFSWESNSNSGYGTAIVGTVSGTSISFGSAVVFNSRSTSATAIAYDENAQKCVVVYRDTGASGRPGRAKVATISGTSVSFGSEGNITNNNAGIEDITYDASTQKVVAIWTNYNSGSVGCAAVGTISGTSISFGNQVTFESGNTTAQKIVYDSSAQKVLIAYKDDGDSEKGKCVVGTVSGTNISFGSIVVFDDSNLELKGISLAYDANASKTVISFIETGTSPRSGKNLPTTISGTTPSFGTATNFSTIKVIQIGSVYDPDQKKVVVVYGDEGGNDSNYGTAKVFQNATDATNLTSENYIGMSQGSVVDNSVPQAVGTPAVFNSALAYNISATFDSNSNKVVLSYANASNYGTAVVGTVSGNSISFGTPVVYLSAAVGGPVITFDSNSNKVVVAYRDSGASNTGKARVGTVSGTSISFGTEASFFNAAANFNAITFDSNSNKIVIAFRPPSPTYSSYLSVVVGTISGTNISFGSRVVANAANSSQPSLAFDSNLNKVVLGYRTTVGSSGPPAARVGTVSGTSISFGSEAVIQASINIGRTSTVFDSNSNKVAISYIDGTNGGIGSVAVGTVSGTSISFGSVVTFSAADTDYPLMVFDSANNKIGLSYVDDADSDKGEILVGTISGTSISFESPVEFTSSNISFVGSTFDSNAGKVVTAYRDNGASDYGKAVVFQVGTTDITRGQVASGSSGTVDIIGSVSTNQSGLTAGQSYFVQTDGTIGTTAANPSVFAGTAISATRLIVKT